MAKSSKGKSQTVQKTELDPSTKALNEMTLRMFEDLEPLRRQVIQSLMDPQAAGPDGMKLPTGNLASAFRILNDMRNIGNIQNEARSRFSNITVPNLVNQMTAAGFGRSGAIGDAIAKGGAEMTLPLLEMSRQGDANFVNALMGLENAKLAPVMGLLGQPAPFTPAPTMTSTTRTSGGSGGNGWLGALSGAIQGGSQGFMAGGPWGAVGGALGGGVMGGLNSMQQQPNRFSIG